MLRGIPTITKRPEPPKRQRKRSWKRPAPGKATSRPNGLTSNEWEKQLLVLVEGDRTREPLARWQQTFLRALRQLPSVRDACRAAKVSRQCAYRHRKKNAEFAALWADALHIRSMTLRAWLSRWPRRGILAYLVPASLPPARNLRDTQRHEVGLVGGIVFLPQKTEGAE